MIRRFLKSAVDYYRSDQLWIVRNAGRIECVSQVRREHRHDESLTTAAN